MAVVNSNVPNMLGQISTDLADVELNILDMLNKSRGEVAVTLIDVDRRAARGDREQDPLHRRRAVGALPGLREAREVTAGHER